MMRRFVLAAVMVAVTVGFAFSETLVGQITGVKDGKVTFKVLVDKANKTYGDPKDYPLAENVKLYKKGMKGQPGDLDVEGKAKVAESDFVKAIADAKGGKGGNVTLEVIDGKVTEIKPGGGKGKKGA